MTPDLTLTLGVSPHAIGHRPLLDGLEPGSLLYQSLYDDLVEDVCSDQMALVIDPVGLVHARQEFYHPATSPKPSFYVLFSDRISLNCSG